MGFYRDLFYQCPDPHSPRSERLRGRVEWLLERGSEVGQGPTSPDTVREIKIASLKFRVRFLDRERTVEAAVQLGVALAALHAF